MWLHKAALEDCNIAQNKVGSLYQDGQSVSQDYKLAMQ
jgi:TPR repeat protein